MTSHLSKSHQQHYPSRSLIFFKCLYMIIVLHFYTLLYSLLLYKFCRGKDTQTKILSSFKDNCTTRNTLLFKTNVFKVTFFLKVNIVSSYFPSLVSLLLLDNDSKFSVFHLHKRTTIITTIQNALKQLSYNCRIAVK